MSTSSAGNTSPTARTKDADIKQRASIPFSDSDHGSTRVQLDRTRMERNSEPQRPDPQTHGVPNSTRFTARRTSHLLASTTPVLAEPNANELATWNEDPLAASNSSTYPYSSTQKILSSGSNLGLTSRRVSKTCQNCFSLKIRCDRTQRQDICNRCARLGKHCVFRPARRRDNSAKRDSRIQALEQQLVPEDSAVSSSTLLEDAHDGDVVDEDLVSLERAEMVDMFKTDMMPDSAPPAWSHSPTDYPVAQSLPSATGHFSAPNYESIMRNNPFATGTPDHAPGQHIQHQDPPSGSLAATNFTSSQYNGPDLHVRHQPAASRSPQSDNLRSNYYDAAQNHLQALIPDQSAISSATSESVSRSAESPPIYTAALPSSDDIFRPVLSDHTSGSSSGVADVPFSSNSSSIPPSIGSHLASPFPGAPFHTSYTLPVTDLLADLSAVEQEVFPEEHFIMQWQNATKTRHDKMEEVTVQTIYRACTECYRVMLPSWYKALVGKDDIRHIIYRSHILLRDWGTSYGVSDGHLDQLPLEANDTTETILSFLIEILTILTNRIPNLTGQILIVEKSVRAREVVVKPILLSKATSVHTTTTERQPPGEDIDANEDSWSLCADELLNYVQLLNELHPSIESWITLREPCPNPTTENIVQHGTSRIHSEIMVSPMNIDSDDEKDADSMKSHGHLVKKNEKVQTITEGDEEIHDVGAETFKLGAGAPAEAAEEVSQPSVDVIDGDMSPNWAISDKPYTFVAEECSSEAERLKIAVEQAEARNMNDTLTEIREWAIAKTRVQILQIFSRLSTTRKEAHLAYIKSLPNYDTYMKYKGRPPLAQVYIDTLEAQIREAQAELKLGIDADWRASVLHYPEGLDYFYSLAYLHIPSDSDERVLHFELDIEGYDAEPQDSDMEDHHADDGDDRYKRRKAFLRKGIPSAAREYNQTSNEPHPKRRKGIHHPEPQQRYNAYDLTQPSDSRRDYNSVNEDNGSKATSKGKEPKHEPSDLYY